MADTKPPRKFTRPGDVNYQTPKARTVEVELIWDEYDHVVRAVGNRTTNRPLHLPLSVDPPRPYCLIYGGADTNWKADTVTRWPIGYRDVCTKCVGHWRELIRHGHQDHGK